MFTRNRKSTPMPTEEELAALSLSDGAKKRTEQVKSHGDEIERIAQDFQVAQLESLKAQGQADVPTAPAAKVIRSQPAVEVTPTTDNKPMVKEENQGASNPLFDVLLSEIVEKDISHHRERLAGKK